MQQDINNKIHSLQNQLNLQAHFGASDQQLQIQPSPNNINQVISYIQNIQKVFLNSLKLNQKLYSEITKKEASISLEAMTFLDTSSRIDQKIQDSLKKTKQLYQDTVHQNQKARYLLEQFINPIREELKSKVDQTKFTLEMKMLLDQYDSMGHHISYNNQDENIKQQRKKAISSETLSFLKDRILPLMSKLQQKVNDTSLIEKSSQKIKSVEMKSNGIELEIQIIKNNLNQAQEKTVQRINDKLSDSFLDKKIRDNMKVYLLEVQTQISKQILKLKHQNKENQQRLSHQIESLRSSMLIINSGNKVSEQQIKTQISQIKKQLQHQQQIIKKLSMQASNLIKKTQSYDDLMFKNIYQKLEALESKATNKSNIPENLFKPQELSNLFNKHSSFASQIKKIKRFQKVIQQKVNIQKGQIQGIRDLLSKKANFSDVLQYVQTKVDKQEFKRYKQKVNGLQNHNNIDHKSNLIAKQFDLKQIRKVSTHRKSRSSFFSPTIKQKNDENQNQTEHAKRFQLGFDNELNFEGMIKRQFSKTQYIKNSITSNDPYLKEKGFK